VSAAVVDAVILAVAVGASGWCVWHCVRGIRAMRRDKAATCCPPPGHTNADTSGQLAELRADVELRAAHRDHDDSVAR